MGKAIILDTNIVIGLWNNAKETLSKVPALNTHTRYITIFTYMEFLAPTPARHKAQSRKFLSQFEIIPFTAKSFSQTQNICFSKVTDPRNFIDLLIYANVQSTGKDFVTFNNKDFDRFI